MKTPASLWLAGLALALRMSAHAQILIGPSGTAATITFGSSPILPAAEWASSLTGVGVGSGAYVSAADVAAGVQTINQSSITNALERITVNTLSEDARHNTAGGYLLTQSSGVGATLLKATLRNSSTQPISHITVGYNFGVAVAPGTETAPGHRAFFSTNGQANSWQAIPQFSGLSSAAYVSATLFVGTWMPNTDIYLLWADDNTDENPDGGYTIDNFSVSNVVVAAPPGNDMCSGAFPLTDDVSFSMNTANATSAGDPGSACVPPGNTLPIGKGVWFMYRHFRAGQVFLRATGSSFPVGFQVYTGGFSNSCDTRVNLTSCGSFMSSGGGQPYWICAGGISNASGDLTIRATVCITPDFNSVTAFDSVPEAGGVRVFYRADFTKSDPGFYTWKFDFGLPTSFMTNTFTINGNADVISRLYGPFDPLPTTLNVSFGNDCTGDNGNGNPTPPCGGICLAVGSPVTRTGTDGSGTNGFDYGNVCGQFPSASTRWFRMNTLTNATGLATVSTEGSTYDTVLAVYRGNVSSPNSLVFVTCNNDINATNKRSRVQFETKAGSNYWLAVNSTNVGTLNLTYDYEVKISSLTYNKTNRAVNLRSAPLASLPYQYSLLTATNLTNNPASWSVLLNTNFSAANPASNNVLQYFHTNPATINRRFYRIQPFP